MLERRMTQQFPAPPLSVTSRRSALVWVLVAGGLLAATTGMLVAGDALNTWAAGGGLVLYISAATILMAQVTTHHPHPRFGGANAVTLMRLVITCLFAAFTLQTFFAVRIPDTLAWGFFAAVLLAMLLDGIDGYIARRQGLASPFGARFDMETDAGLILLLSIAAYTLGKAGAWVMLSGALRYLFVAAGWVWPALTAPLPPSHRRKLICVIQIAALTLQLAPVIAPPLSTAIAFAALVLLVYSFAVDVVWSVRHGMPTRESSGPTASA